jgi:hypothetical protein
VLNALFSGKFAGRHMPNPTVLGMKVNDNFGIQMFRAAAQNITKRSAIDMLLLSLSDVKNLESFTTDIFRARTDSGFSTLRGRWDLTPTCVSPN